ncbi:hypothetical protein JCM33374_g4288 [Metschnikowia sp. JCM 33374]|nr:hypothetical protein JCM33374_g4288 [Metschnikowia sp. JCM 33374]
MSLLMSEPTPQPSQPVKRKRGRPPKANKPEDAFPTFTMQLQSSPLSGSPNAERTSSQVVRIGEPDSFTPVMKVMPSPHRKKRRKSSHFSSPLDPPRFPSIEELSTPIVKPGIASSGSNKLHSRGLDKLSIMVNNVTNVAAHLNTPPDSVLRPGFSLSSGDLSESLKEKSCLPEAQVRRHKHSSGSPHLFEKDTGYHMHNSTPISEPISESAWGSDSTY